MWGDSQAGVRGVDAEVVRRALVVWGVSAGSPLRFRPRGNVTATCILLGCDFDGSC